jgi:hypothetical protein
MSSRQAERAIELLERQLEETDDPKEQAAIRQELREMDRELADAERWREEGRERGFQ